MSRIRSIKPEFFTSAQVLECSPNARLLFVGLWCFCDDQGRHPFSPKQAKAEVFPADETITIENVRRMLDELSANDLIRVYDHSGVPLFFVTGWKHQKIDRPQAARYPDPPEAVVSADSSSIRRTLAPDPIRSDPIREDSHPTGESHPQKKKAGSPEERGLVVTLADFVDEVAEGVRAYNAVAREHHWPIATLPANKTREAKLRARLGECGGLDGWREAMVRAGKSPFLTGTSGRTEDHANWRPGLDFFLQAKSFTKLMEGQYDGHAGSGSGVGRGSAGDSLTASMARVAADRARQRGGQSVPDDWLSDDTGPAPGDSGEGTIIEGEVVSQYG